jgi:hypothetical protein
MLFVLVKRDLHLLYQGFLQIVICIIACILIEIRFSKALSHIPTDISDDMSRKIYVRERQKVSDGAHQPKYRIAAIVSDDDKGPFIKINAEKKKKKELEQIAADIHAEIVYLESEPDGEHGHRK